MFDNPTSQYEFKHAFHSISDGADIITIKYIEHTESGEKIPHYDIIKDYERPAWVTLPRHRKYNDKKTYESIDRLTMIKSTEANMARALSAALGQRFTSRTFLNDVLSSPYVYGLGASTTSLIKHKIREKWPTAVSDNVVCVGDIETSMLDDDEHILCMAVTCKDKVHLAVLKDFVKNIKDPISELKIAAKKYLNEDIHKRVKDFEFEICETPATVVMSCLKRLHEWKPDFLAFWNMNFDIPRCIEALEREGYDPKDYFNDPSVPHKWRYLKYYEQKSNRESSGGRKLNKSPSELWHVLENHASWYVIDPMCYYRKNRLHLQQEQSYTLDYLGDKIVNMKKLRFDKAEHVIDGSKQWHRLMQSTYPIEYCIYNIQDCILVELIDEKTGDLARTIQQASDDAEYRSMFRLPSVLEHRLFFELYKEKGLILGQAGRDMRTELDKHVIGTDDIIVMLPSHLIEDNGITLFEDASGIVSQCRLAPADDDIESTYPTGQRITNLERETIKREMVSLGDMSEDELKQVGYAIATGVGNSVTIARKLYNCKSLLDLDDVL